jgi:hypothetical protein
MNGSNSKENLVELTPREHFICHRLLVRMTDDAKLKKSFRWALHRMMFSKADTHESKYVPNGRIFELLRLEFNEAAKKPRVLSPEHRAKLIAFNESRKGRKLSDETRAKMSAARMGKESPNKGKARSEDSKRKQRESIAARDNYVPWNKGIRLSDEDKQKISDGLKASKRFQQVKHDRVGVKLSDDTRKKMSEAHKNKPLTAEHAQAIKDGHKRKFTSCG